MQYGVILMLGSNDYVCAMLFEQDVTQLLEHRQNGAKISCKADSYRSASPNGSVDPKL